MRYFPNKLPDFVQGSRVAVDSTKWKPVIQNLVDMTVQKMPPTFQNCDGGLYVGCAGVGYMFYYLANSEAFADKRGEYLTRARNYTEVSLSYSMSRQNRDPPAAFLLGSAGPQVVGSMLYHDLGDKKTSEELMKKVLALCAMCQPVNYLPKGSDELLVGRAGFLSGCYVLNRKFGNVVPKEALDKICQATVHSGREYSKRHRSPCPLMYAYYDTEYLGAAHGLAGILQMLLCNPEFIRSDAQIESDVRASVDYMLSLMQPNGNIAPALDEIGSSRRPESEELVHWCHGGPGIVYLFAKAFLFWKDEKYLSASLRCGELTWQKGLLRKGPGICHGVAGSGYVFLLLYRLTSDEKHLHRAQQFAEFLLTPEFQQGARTPDTPFSLYEGYAGTACFLADLLQPLKAEFPFYDIFSY